MINALLRLTVKRQWRPGLQIDEVRRHAARSDARLARRGPPCATEDLTVAGVPARWFGAPELATTTGTMLYLHGGAWCLHLPALYAALAATLSRRTGLRVLVIDYRLAPEHPFPAAVDDCFAVYRALAETGSTPRVIAGDSAGGSLSLVTLQRARDAGLPMPSCAVLLSPSTDLTMSGASARYNADKDPMFSAAATGLVPDWYFPGQPGGNSQISPLFGAWHALPPLYFLAGSTEMLLDDSVRAQDRARQAGVDARLDVWPDLPHVFPVFSILPEARDALGRIAAFIEEHARSRPQQLEEVARPAAGTMNPYVGVTAESATRPSL
jgi:epsilon-lactone hydrolase